MATNIAGLDAQIDQLLADNTNEDITPLDLRTVLKQFSSSCAVNQDIATITGAWTFSVPVSGVTPTAAAHLATKDYVDNNAGVSAGDVVGPSSATDNALVRFNLTTGKLIQGGSGVTVSDVGNFAGVGNITFLTGLNTVAGIQNQNLVDKTANETIASGATWTFTDSPIVPTPTTDFQAATKKYVDDNIGAGTVTASGTPVDNQLAVWTSATNVEGDSNLTWDGSTLAVGGAFTATTVNGIALTTGGSAANVLAENGSYVALSGGGDVVKVGTPVNNQIGIWTGDGTIEGDANFTWDGSTFAVTGAQTISSTLDVSGAFTALSGAFENSDAGTNTVLTALTVDRQTSGTPAVGIGVGVDFNVETSAANVETLGVIDVTATDVTLAGEDGKFSFKLMTGGSAATEKMSIDVDGDVAATSFNSVPLTAGGSASNFLTAAGTYVSIGSLGGGDVNKVGTPVNNQIGVWTGDGTIEGDANFTWDGSTFAVTGAQTISSTLDVSGVISASSSTSSTVPYYTFQTDTNTGISRSAADTLSFITGGVEAFNIDSSQNIQVNGSINITSNTSDGNDNQAIAIFGGGANLSTRGAAIAVYGNEYPTANGRLSLRAGNVIGGEITFATGSNNISSMDENGDWTYSGEATFGSGTTGSISVTVEDQSIADDEFREFRASATHNSNTTTSAIGVRTHSGLTNGVSYLFMRAEDQANSWVWFDNSNDMRRSISVTDLGTTNGTVIGTQTSDERFKDNLRSLGYGLSEILALPTYKYERNGVTEIGFGAQSTINIIPEAVYDTGEEVEGENQSKYAMDYSRIVPVLVEAIKELKAEIDALKG